MDYQELLTIPEFRFRIEQLDEPPSDEEVIRIAQHLQNEFDTPKSGELERLYIERRYIGLLKYRRKMFGILNSFFQKHGIRYQSRDEPILRIVKALRAPGSSSLTFDFSRFKECSANRASISNALLVPEFTYELEICNNDITDALLLAICDKTKSLYYTPSNLWSLYYEMGYEKIAIAKAISHKRMINLRRVIRKNIEGMDHQEQYTKERFS